MLFVVFLFGLVLGSFLNVCIYRIPRQESVVFPASHCASCGSMIKPRDLIPVMSYLLLRGKCRSCKQSISPRYPLVELSTAGLLVGQYWKWDISVPFILFSVLTALLIVTAMVDFDHQMIPDRFILMIAVLGFINLFWVRISAKGISALLDSVVGFLVGGLIFLLISVVSGGGMGGGDIKLIAALGLWFGLNQLLLLMFLSFVLGAIISVPLLLLRRKKRTDGIPFGPFIALAAYLVSLFGEGWLSWYFRVITM